MHVIITFPDGFFHTSMTYFNQTNSVFLARTVYILLYSSNKSTFRMLLLKLIFRWNNRFWAAGEKNLMIFEGRCLTYRCDITRVGIIFNFCDQISFKFRVRYMFILNRVKFLLNSVVSLEASLTRAGVFLLLASYTFWPQRLIIPLAEEEARLRRSRCFTILAKSSLEDQVDRRGQVWNFAESVTVCLGMQTRRWLWSEQWVCLRQTTHRRPGFLLQLLSYSMSASRNLKRGKGWAYHIKSDVKLAHFHIYYGDTANWNQF